MRLELGGGLAPAPGHVNIDLIPTADIVWNLNKGLPPTIENCSVDGIRASHLIEHLDSIIPLMNDCFRVLKKGAVMELSTPLAGTTQFWQDPTHKRGYVQDTFLYFIENSPFGKEQAEYGITARFVIDANFLEDHWQIIVTLKKP